MQQVTLLWTGGWDSTFRLLQLLHDTQASVQPLYLVDDERGSVLKEMRVMKKIRRSIRKQMPLLSKRMLPTDYGSYRATIMEPHHRYKWNALSKRGRIGLQYPILASFAEQTGCDAMELCIESTTDSARILKSVVEPEDTSVGTVYILPADTDGVEQLFRYFTFPLLDYTKLNMLEEAKRRGWMSIMTQTWFCFNPTAGFPCGMCQTCRIAKRDGLGKRVGRVGPLLGRGRAFVDRFVIRPGRFYVGAVLRTIGLK